MGGQGIQSLSLIHIYKAAVFGRDRHPAECDCQRAAREEREAAEKRRRHLDTVEELKRRGFTDLTMQEWTFAHDNGKCLQMSKAHLYVEHWEQVIVLYTDIHTYPGHEKTDLQYVEYAWGGVCLLYTSCSRPKRSMLWPWAALPS